MNHINARIGKLWAAGVRDVAKISRKIGRPGPAGEDRVLDGLRFLGLIPAIPAPGSQSLVPAECCRVLGPPRHLSGKKPPEDGAKAQTGLSRKI